MKPREIIEAVLTFGGPPRIGMNLLPPYPYDMVNGSIAMEASVPLEPRPGEQRRWRDAWGVTWASLTETDKGEVVEGAIRDWSNLERWTPPNLGDPERFRAAEALFRTHADLWPNGHLPGFTFNIARKLRKLENYLADLLTEPEQVDHLHARLRESLLRAIDRFAGIGARSIMIHEDWGTQQGLMISPALWRERFLPDFQLLAGRVREHGMQMIMHSCGKMTAIMDDCIAAGVTCFQFDQPRLHGIDTLAERFAGRASFWCPVDIQRTQQSRDPGLIREEARALIDRLGGGGRGGFIAGCYTDHASIGITPETTMEVCRAFHDLGWYESCWKRDHERCCNGTTEPEGSKQQGDGHE